MNADSLWRLSLSDEIAIIFAFYMHKQSSICKRWQCGSAAGLAATGTLWSPSAAHRIITHVMEEKPFYWHCWRDGGTQPEKRRVISLLVLVHR